MALRTGERLNHCGGVRQKKWFVVTAMVAIAVSRAPSRRDSLRECAFVWKDCEFWRESHNDHRV